MRKRKLSVVLLLILVVVMTSVFVACNQTDTTTPQGPPIIENPTGPSTGLEGGRAIDSRQAWYMLKNAAFASVTQEKDTRYVNVDTAFVIGYAKDDSESVFVMRIAAALNLVHIDTPSAVKDQFLVELRQFAKSEITDLDDNSEITALAKNDGGKLLAGFYFYEGKLVADGRGIKNAAGETGESVHVVWTDN
ncbi:MAG: hypothetical protein K2N18_01925, partial [Clostridia bacterium]|nr:hypothetical protein [Clostridia bacterium]